MAAIKRAALAMYYRILGKHGRTAEEKAKEAARHRLAETATDKVREAVETHKAEHDEVTDMARRTIGLIARTNARLS